MWREDPIACALLAASGLCALYALVLLIRAKEKDHFVVTLRELGIHAGYLQEKEASRKQILSIDELAKLWRQPVGYFHEDYRPKIQNENAKDFFREYVQTSPWFDRKKLLHRGIIAQLLERYDKEHPSPSVVKNPAFREDHDTKWSKQSYEVLRQVSLLDHVLNAASVAVAHLIEREETWQIPRVLIAVLAHDLGKLPSVNGGKDYATGVHPVNAANLLRTIEGFDQLPSREEILKAVISHHDSGPLQGLAALVQYADRGARKFEYQAYAGNESVPEWIAPVTLPAIERILNPYAPLPCDSDDALPGAEEDDPGFFSLQTRQALQSPGKPQPRPPAAVEPPKDFSQPPPQQPSLAHMREQDEHASPLQDAKWEDAIAIARGCADIELKEFAERLRIGKTRAQAMLEILRQGGYFLDPQNQAEPAGLSEDTREDAPGRVGQGPGAKLSFLPETPEQLVQLFESGAQEMKEIIALVDGMSLYGVSEEVPPACRQKSREALGFSQATPEAIAPASGSEEEPRFLSGTRTVFDLDLGGEGQGAGEAKPLTSPLADISPWFRPDEALRELQLRLDVDQKTLDRGRGFWQGVSDLTTHTAWFNVQALKDIAGRQIEKHTQDYELSEQITSQDALFRPIQDSILRAMVGYFRDNGLLRNLLAPNAYCVPVWLTEQTGDRREAWMVPFRLYPEFYATKKEASQRKKANPLVARVIAVQPQGPKAQGELLQGE
ncbi:HD domain-containing protein [Geoalkalibacter sp.]|uniref:HD domain-containing protein n=1 Tax=Geoalkalibacter sp. TaxID=3041440 RepID=UPI00272EBF88|nr:HD domain-containing protein [Geoalkalibacter sp.]